MGQKDLPLAHWRDHLKAFERLGWSLARDNPHVLLEREGHRATLSIPRHGEVKRALLARLLKDAGITEQEYLDAFHRRGRFR